MVRREACIVNLESKLRRLSRDSGGLEQVGLAGRARSREEAHPSLPHPEQPCVWVVMSRSRSF